MPTTMSAEQAKQRLEYLRGELDAERISYDELHELQSLVEYIEPDDVQLLAAAGVPERHNMSCTLLPTFMAKACHYAQEHIDDTDAWPHDNANREQYLTCVSFQMACFFAQNTVKGGQGVESDVLIRELTALPMKSEKQWLKIINKIANDLGGWSKG